MPRWRTRLAARGPTREEMWDLPRPRMGRAGARRSEALRVPDRSKARRPDCRGRRSSTSATAIAGRSPTSIRRRSRGSRRAKSRSCCSTPASCAIARRSSRAVSNAQACSSTLVEEVGSFDKYIWGFVGGKPIVNRWKTTKQIPATSKRIGRARRGPQEARLQVRRLDGHVRPHAGDRARQRSPRRVAGAGKRSAVKRRA